MTGLRVAPGLELPLDTVTRRLAVLGMSGAGKSNVAVVLAEAMFDAQLPWVAIDPKGDWWGVRSSKSGKGPGLPVPIFGGLHGDLPLDPSAGAFVGELIVGQRLTCVLDVSEMPDRQSQWRFLADLGETLLKRNRAPLHVFLEEADEYLPQRTSEKGQLPRCLGVWQRVVKRGRFRGLGSTQITQRNASLNKDTLYQAELIVAMRSTGKGDRQAVEGWVEHHNASREIVASLPGLADGEGWASSPAWLRRTDRVQFARRRTFDSGGTPVLLDRNTPAATLADVDLARIERKMASTIERVKADDPAALRRQLAERDRQLRELKLVNERHAAAAPPPEIRTVEVPVLGKAELHRLEEAAGRVLDAVQSVRQTAAALGEVSQGIGQLLDHARGLAARAAIASASSAPKARVAFPGAPARPQPPAAGGEIRLRKGARRMLEAIGRRYPAPTTEAQMAQLADLARTGGTFSTYKSELVRGGYVTETRDGLELTPDGWAAAGMAPGSASPQTTDEVLRLYSGVLRAGTRRMLDAAMQVYPSPISKAAVAAEARVAQAGGTFSTYLSDLRKAGLVEDFGDEIRASELLMNPGSA